jgi:ubiquinone/menaquinone biosynthesis C-methylase UbiE
MLFRVFSQALKPPARVLDAGAGAGSFAGKLAEAGYAVAGIDQSERFVAYAGDRVAGASFQVGDVTALAFPDASFEGVVAGEVLEHVPDHERAVAEFWRVLKPGGVCVVSVPADPALWDASDEWAGHVRRYTAEELRGLFEGRGFVVRRLFRWGFPFTRLYHRWAYLPMLKRKLAAGDAPAAKLTGWKRWAARLFESVLRIDRLFEGAPWGIGYVLVASKLEETTQ